MKTYQEVQKSLERNQYTWLITGVAGFIGSNLLEKLLILDQKVIGLDNFETGYQSNIDEAINDASNITGKNKKENFTFYRGDLFSLDVCKKACKKADFVLHQAALGSVPRSIKNPIKTNQANVDGFLNMLVAARDANVKRFVYAASSSTYGDHQDLPKIEARIGNPLSPYAVTKLINELYAQVFSKTYSIETIGLRYFNVFGKRQDPKGAYAAVIPKWIHGLINGKQVFINGDGKTSRDFCYVENIVQINILAALTNNAEAINQIYNAAFSQRTDLNTLFQLIKKRVEKICKISENNLTYKDFRQGDVRHSEADITKAKTLLNYEPKFDLKKGLDEAMIWYLNNLNDKKD